MKHLLAIFLVATTSMAEDAKPSETKVEPYKLKNRSTFTVDSEARAPFWPIGWVKPKAGDNNPARVKVPGSIGPKQKFEIQPQHFNVTSVLLGNPALATINGRTFAQGEVLPVVAGQERLRVILKAVRDGGIWLEYGAQQIYVPIHRPEVGKRASEPQPVSTDFQIKIGAQP